MARTDQDNNREYPPIESLAAIGDGRSLTLLAPDGTLEWFCPARFDHPPLLWSLLDRQNGGRLCIAAKNPTSSSMRYWPETAVLEYEWITSDGTARAQVCMQWPESDGQQRLLWLITGMKGSTEIYLDFLPRPGFSRETAPFELDLDAVHFSTGEHRASFQTTGAVEPSPDGIHGETTVKAGETVSFCLTIATEPNQKPDTVALSSVAQRIKDTAAAWQAWTAAIEWHGPYRDAVVRSAITLKLLIYEPTGAVVAAGTTGLPETIGGGRNWDYRFTWFRDAGLVLDALYSLGCEREAHRWAEWMQNTIMRHRTPLQVLYTVEGQAPPSEEACLDIEGYRQSAPVHIGNAADGQFQLDIYGELLECVFICDNMNDDVMRKHWDHLRKAADFIAAHWHEPDCGIWEVRSEPKHFVHSKVAAWAGLQRALWLQRRHQLDCDSDTWRREADAIKRDVLQNGISKDTQHFTRAYDDPGLDASLLLLARYGFVEGMDQYFQNTVDAIRKELCVGNANYGLLRRYLGNDGLSGEEGAFIICSFWLVDALARGGRTEEAEAVFQRLLSLQGTCGLYAEQIDPVTKVQLGNVPQAFSHVGLINAALQLEGKSAH